MKEKVRHPSGRPRVDHAVFVVLLVLGGCFLAVSQAEAVLTVQTMNGTVEVFLAGEKNWKPFTAALKLKSGDQIRTGINSAVELGLEDGSVFKLTDATQLAITQLDLSTERKARIARFKLGWGTVTVKLAKLAYTESTCEVETDTVAAGGKFSELTVMQPQNMPQAEVIGREGLFEVKRLGSQRQVKISGLLDEKNGIEFSLPDAIGAKIAVGIYAIVTKITLESPLPVRDLRLLLDSAGSLVKIDNLSKAPLHLNVKELAGILAAQGSVTLGYPPAQEALLNFEGGSISLSIKKQGAIQCNGVYLFLNGGSLTVNGQPVEIGVPKCFPVKEARSLLMDTGKKDDGKEPATRVLNQPGEEQPVTPNAPPQNQPSGSGVFEIEIPELTPTPTPLIEQTPLPEQTPAPTVTPTAIPTATPTPTPAPSQPEPQPQPPAPPQPVPPPPPPPPPASPSRIVPR